MSRQVIILFFFFLSLALGLVYFSTEIWALFESDNLTQKFFEVTDLGDLTFYGLLANVGVFALVGAIEIGFVGWQKSSINRLVNNRNSSTLTDLWCWILSILGLYRFFGLLLSFGAFYLVVFVLYKYVEPINLHQWFGHVYVQFIFVFILSDFKIFLWHYLMHRLPFWELHKMHHSATEFNIITNSRVHFLEISIGMVFDAIAFLLLGVPVEYYLFFVYLKEVHASLLHSNVEHSFGWVGKYLIISPNGHRIHHSKDERHHNKNFGAMFTWWDHLFGTFYISDDPIEIGIKDDRYNSNGFWYDIFAGLKSFVRSSIGGTIRNK